MPKATLVHQFDEVLLCKVIYEVIIETKENLTQIKISLDSCHICITTNKDDQNYSAEMHYNCLRILFFL